MFALGHHKPDHVTVQCAIPVFVVDLHIVAVTVVVALGPDPVPVIGGDHGAGGRRNDRGAFRRRNVGAGVAAAHPAANLPVLGHRPDKLLPADLSVHGILQLGAGHQMLGHRLSQRLHSDGAHLGGGAVHKNRILGDFLQAVLAGLQLHRLAVLVGGGFLGVGGVGDSLGVGTPLDGADLQRLVLGLVQLADHLRHRQDRIGKEQPVRQLDLAAELHPLIRVVHVGMGRQQALQVTAQVVPLAGDHLQRPVHIDSGGLLQRTAGSLQQRIDQLCLGHRPGKGHGKPVTGVHLNGFLVPPAAGGQRDLPGVLDPLVDHGLGGVQNLLVLDVADHLAVHLHLQQIGAPQPGAHQQHAAGGRQHHGGPAGGPAQLCGAAGGPGLGFRQQGQQRPGQHGQQVPQHMDAGSQQPKQEPGGQNDPVFQQKADLI